MFNLSTQEVVLSIEKSPLRIVHGTMYQEYQDFFGKEFSLPALDGKRFTTSACGLGVRVFNNKFSA